MLYVCGVCSGFVCSCQLPIKVKRQETRIRSSHEHALVRFQDHGQLTFNTKDKSSQLDWKSGPNQNEQLVQQRNGERKLRKRWHLTDRAKLAAAVRRQVANVPASGLGACVMADLSKQVVNEAEVLLGACRVGSFKRFHTDAEADMISATLDPVVSVVSHAFSFWASVT